MSTVKQEMIDADDMRHVQEQMMPRFNEINTLRAVVDRLASEFRGMDDGFRAQLQAKYELEPQDRVDMRSGVIVRGPKPLVPESPNETPADPVRH